MPKKQERSNTEPDRMSNNPSISPRHARLKRAVRERDFSEMIAIARQGPIEGAHDTLARALGMAAAKNDLVAVNELLTVGADPNLDDPDKGSPTYRAASTSVEVLHALLQAGGNPDGGRYAPIWAAVYAQREELVEVLIAAKASIQIVTDRGMTPLHRATTSRKEIMQMLLQAGADVHAKDCDGETPLHTATRSHFSEQAIQLLLQHGAALEARTTEGRTALLTAAHYGNTEAFFLLVQLGADPLPRDNEGRSALDLSLRATNWVSETIALWMLEHYPEVAPTGELLDQTFVMSVKDGYLELTRKLIALGADIGQKPDGRTLLQCAPPKAQELKRLLRSLKTGQALEGAMSEGDDEGRPASPNSPSIL